MKYIDDVFQCIYYIITFYLIFNLYFYELQFVFRARIRPASLFIWPVLHFQITSNNFKVYRLYSMYVYLINIIIIIWYLTSLNVFMS